MKSIVLLATPCTRMSSLDNPLRGFQTANEFLKKQGKPPLFKIQVTGAQKNITLNNGLYSIYPDVLLDEVKAPDLILIPAIEGNIALGVEQNKALIPWLIHHYKNGAELASVCVGAFLLAATGLLNGKSCSTHWRSEQAFRQLFPKVNLITDKIMTDEQGLYTGGGAFSSANLILYLIEKFAGREAAIYCSKMFQVDLDRRRQSQFIIFNGQKNHQDKSVKKAQAYIEKNYRKKITVKELTSFLAISRRSLERRFKKTTTNTVVEYIQRVKIEAVKKRLETGRKTVNELMYEVGYNDPKSFRILFKKYTGLTPVAYRKKYNKEEAVAL